MVGVKTKKERKLMEKGKEMIKTNVKGKERLLGRSV